MLRRTPRHVGHRTARSTNRLLATTTCFVVGAVATLLAEPPTAPASALAARDPAPLTLRQADVGGSRLETEYGLDDYLKAPLRAAGLSGRAARYLGQTYAPRSGLARIGGVVITLSTQADARRAFAAVAKARDRLVRRSTTGWDKVSLRAYGDEQRAFVDPPGNEGIGTADLLVRRRAVVWLLSVTLESRPRPAVRELLGVLEGLAARQQRRIEAG